MNLIERKAVISLSAIMGLRMMGLFMVLPVFTLYSSQLRNATPILIGIAMGIYGLSQALLQIPFGHLSDRLGRKPIILLGLIIFSIGSLIAAFSDSIYFMIIGRFLQGGGAIGSALLAMMADLTRPEQRSKSMAIAGMTIGFSFCVAILLGPLLTRWLPINYLFHLAAVCGCGGILILYTTVPTPLTAYHDVQRESNLRLFLTLLKTPALNYLNLGIFLLHVIFTASFVIIPIAFYYLTGLSAQKQWHLYLPALLAAFVVSFIAINHAEKTQRLKFYFLMSIVFLVLGECLLWLAAGNITLACFGLGLFFTGFSLLEAFLPALISNAAPAAHKGSALGIYSCSQFLGIFVGGVLGGWLYGHFSFAGVYLMCVMLALCWFAFALLMKPPRYLVTHMLRLLPKEHYHWESIRAALQLIPGIAEVTFIAEDGTIYIKMEREAAEHPDFIRLKEQLQTNY